MLGLFLTVGTQVLPILSQFCRIGQFKAHNFREYCGHLICGKSGDDDTMNYHTMGTAV
jgi:hypothetical protein